MMVVIAICVMVSLASGFYIFYLPGKLYLGAVLQWRSGISD